MERTLEGALAKAFSKGPAAQAKVRRLRRDPHVETEHCWLHAPDFCLCE